MLRGVLRRKMIFRIDRSTVDTERLVLVVGSCSSMDRAVVSEAANLGSTPSGSTTLRSSTYALRATADRSSYAWLRHVKIEASERALHSPEGDARASNLSMHYVYILRSINRPSEVYVGYTLDLRARLETHNSGKSPHTSKHRPWKIIFYCAFESEKTAKAFEIYLKSHSGKAFTTKRLL